MIPLGDQGAEPGRGFPVVNIALIALNVVMFIIQTIYGDQITNGWSLVPKEIATGQDIIGNISVAGGQIALYPAPLGNVYLTLLTSMFMHANILHIASNMLFLFIFGDNVEYNFGSVKYLIFYLLCGFGADISQMILGGTDSYIPNLGASGAIAGVLGAYIVLFPRAQVRALIALGVFFTVTMVPAFIMIGLWILTQIFSVFSMGTAGGGVAYWAHVGGFIVGLILVFVLRNRNTSSSFPAYQR